MKRRFTVHKGTNVMKKVVMYALLISIGFVFLYPFLYMFINSFMSPEDLMNPAVSWVPTKIYFQNYIKAFETLDFGKSFWNSLRMLCRRSFRYPYGLWNQCIQPSKWNLSCLYL